MKIICPNCRSLLEIGDKPDMADKMMACPICRFRAKVSVFQQQMFNKAKRRDDDDDEPTQVNIGLPDRTIGCLFHGTDEYSLHKGDNTIGRIAKSGHAEVQISDDRYMSRQHAVITIKEGGSGLEHRLCPTNPKNPIKLNGRKLENEDIVILQWGDKLTFGRTELVFERPGFGEEHTLIEEV